LTDSGDAAVSRHPLVINTAHTAELGAAAQIERFIKQCSISILNIAGPRASGWPEAHEYAERTVRALLAMASVPEHR
jgi:hypothetical protein